MHDVLEFILQDPDGGGGGGVVVGGVDCGAPGILRLKFKIWGFMVFKII